MPTTSFATDPGAFATAPTASVGGRISRRTVLAALSALAVGGLTGCSLDGGDQQDMSGLGGTRRGGGAGSAGGGISPKPPLSLNVSCELTEDYFLVQNHKIDPAKDLVVAYSRADGDVEAMILQDGVVKHVYRDPAQAGGWNVAALPDANHVTSMVAGISAAPGSPPALKVFYVRSGSPDTLFVAVEHPASDGTAATFSTTTVPWDSTASSLQISLNQDRSVLVSALKASTLKTGQGVQPDARLYFYADGRTASNAGEVTAPSYGWVTGFTYLPLTNPFSYVGETGTGWSAIVMRPWTRSAPTLLLCLPHGSYVDSKILPQPSVGTWGWALKSGQHTGDKLVLGSGAQTVPPAAPGGVTDYSIDAVTTLGSSYDPQMLVRTLDQDMTQRLWVLSPPENPGGRWSWTALEPPKGLGEHDPVVLCAATRPLPDSENRHDVGPTSFLDVFVVAKNTLSVFRQAPQGDTVLDYTKPLYHPVIPLQPDVALLSSQAGQSRGDELLVVGTDGIVHSLLKDPVTTHWTGSPVHLPASELQQVSAYRTSLGLVDAWGTPVTGRQLRVSSSTPVTALLDGRTIFLGEDAAPLDVDGQGQAVVSVVADGLSAPTLTIDTPDLPQAQVNPSAAINGYLKGGATLNYQIPLTADTLRAAKTPDGKSVAPIATKDAGQAKDAFDNLSTAATWAAAPTLTGARHSHTNHRRDGDATARAGVGAQGVFDDIDHWAHDALHAIKTKAVEVKHVAYEASTRTFTLAADLEAWAKEAVTVVVEGIEDAAHVFHAVLNTIGAAIRDAIAWLEAETLSLLHDTVTLGRQYESWIDDALTQLEGFFGPAHEAHVLGWLDQKQAEVHTLLAQVARQSGSATLTDLGGSTNLRRTAPSAGGGSMFGATGEQGGHPHAGWFFDKVKNALSGDLLVGEVAGFEAMAEDLLTAGGTAFKDIEEAFKSFWAFLETVVKEPSDVPTLGVAKLVDAVDSLLDAAFALAKGIVGAGMALAEQLVGVVRTMLTTPIEEALGLVGKLLALVGLKNVTIGQVISLLFAFPAVLMWKVTNGGKGMPFGLSTTAGAKRLGSGGSDEGLRLAAGTCMGVWAVVDTMSLVVDAAASLEKGEDDQAAGPVFITIVDVLAPIVVGILTVPSTGGGEKFKAPVSDGGDESSWTMMAWISGIIPAFSVAASAFLGRKYPKSTVTRELQPTLLYVSFSCGILSLVAGCAATASSEHFDLEECADAILNSVPYLVVPCVDKDVVKSTGGTSLAVAAALTFICGELGAALYGFYG